MLGFAKVCGFLSALALLACGSDDAARADAGSGGVAGQSGAGAGAAAISGRGGTSGGGAGGRRSPLACEERSSMPVQCGGETCPTSAKFEQDPCFVPCCVMSEGSERCGFRGTSAAFKTECLLPAQDDPSCDEIPQFQGCCEPTQHLCGIIGGFAPGCQTKSSFVTLPKSPKPCGNGSGDSDAGDR